MEPVSIALLALVVPVKAAFCAAQNFFVLLMVAEIAQDKLSNIMKVQQKKEPSVTELAHKAYTTISEIYTDYAHHSRMTKLAQTALSTVQALFCEEVQPERTLADVIQSATLWATKAEFEGEYHIPADTEGDLAFVCYCITHLLFIVVLMRFAYLLCVYVISISRHVCSLFQQTLPFIIIID